MRRTRPGRGSLRVLCATVDGSTLEDEVRL
jgi:hypothetical protein